jgi:hypothetical protein
MKRIRIAWTLVAAVALSSVAIGTAAEAAPPVRNQATVLGHVTIDSNDPSIGYVHARYTCQPEIDHLWVSVKQAADGSADPALTGDGSGFGGIADIWVQSHPADLVCDGKNHVQVFQVDTTEVGYGELVRGQGYVQFCLTSEVNEDLLVFDMTFHQVK